MSIVVLSDNILSPIGLTTAQNLDSISKGLSGLRKLDKEKILEFDKSAESIYSSLIDDNLLAEALNNLNLPDDMTRLEKMIYLSVSDASKRIKLDLSDKSTIFILSTTKGNVSLKKGDKLPLWQTAKLIARLFGNKNLPFLISNACISGVVAIIVAKRLLSSRLYKRAVIIGGDELSPFIVSGFGSFKALSPNKCKPFDKNREGLNLGEAVATLILERVDEDEITQTKGIGIQIENGAISNDANHISGPSRTGEGLYRAIEKCLGPTDCTKNLGFINPHGTATIYNDQMESIAISRSRVATLPILPLKSFYGHTLGASGLLETILSIHFLKDGYLPMIDENIDIGTEPPLQIFPKGKQYNSEWFIKLVSGFGGCNAALKVGKLSSCKEEITDKVDLSSVSLLKEFNLKHNGDSKEFLDLLYRDKNISYPKFHKMDLLSKGALIAMEELLGKPCEEDDKTAFVFYNSSASLSSDNEYYKTIDRNSFFPSPALFVYTLPSIAIGEICIRYKCYGEGIFFVKSEEDDETQIMDYVLSLFACGITNRVVLCKNEVTNEIIDIRAKLLEYSS